MDINTYFASCFDPNTRIAKGRMIKSTAFSCTCHPNKKEDQAHSTEHLKNMVTLLGEVQSLTSAGTMLTRVMMAVAKGDILGSTVWVMSCTNPPVMEAVVAEESSFPIIFPATTSTLSTMLYTAQVLGAQYAWHSPRLNGKSLASTCSNCPQ